MSDKSIIIAPSILAADLSRLQEEVETVEKYADWLQIDVMDGHFVPNLSFGAPVIKNLKTALPLDIHLMVSNPAERIQEFLDIGAANITFHAEAVQKTEERKALIAKIHDGGATAGIAINPETSLDNVGDVLEDIDLLLVMSVHPGFGGQKFIEHVLSDVKTARSVRADLMIQMDGGIDDTTALQCIEAGANNLVSGSFIFNAEDRRIAIESLRPSS
ncbi:ribulose-phosphate 3-epimerase [Candidatus Peregrinibacteria bacterium CG10_big_fil_rev_8_21_14_0_10_42_8]|nr:MAG: ribulose-phosphate 3-epimerase [Candidatus Peregrinibacteria bacterium CG10_big_fil_rev_8_21_14_0_10_42_8]